MSDIDYEELSDALGTSEIASVLGIDVSNEIIIQRLNTKLERATFYYYILTERQKETTPPSRTSSRTKTLIKRVSKLKDSLLGLDRPVMARLIEAANDLGDKNDEPRGAQKLVRAIDDLTWVEKCLTVLERQTQDAISATGGKRKNLARHFFYEQMHDIILEFHGAELQVSTDRITGKKTGPLVDFLELVMAPLNTPSDASTIADAYLDHIQGDNVPK